MKIDSYGAMPFEVNNPPSLRNIRWNLVLALLIDIAAWGVLIAVIAGVANLLK